MVVVETLKSSPLEVPLALGILGLIFFLFGNRPQSNKLWNRIPNVWGNISSRQQRESTFIKNSRETYREGYRRFKSSVYRLTTTDQERLVLSPVYLDELRRFNDEELSIVKAMDTVLEVKLTKLLPNTPHLTHVIRSDLTGNLAALTPRIAEECANVMGTELPVCNDWTAVSLHDPLVRMVAIISGSIFLGPELGRREEFVHSSIHYTIDVFGLIEQLKQWRGYLRWLGWWMAPSRRPTQDHERRVQEFLVPVMQERRRMMRQGEKLPDDMLQWLLNKADQFGNPNEEEMARLQLALSTAAIHTTNSVTLNAIYDIVAQPGLAEALRAEIHDVLAEHDGAFTMQSLYHMKLLDSVMKESQRLNPFNFTRFTRVALKSLTLKDGTFIPQGTFLEIPVDAAGRDPDNYPDPDRFDAWRFYRRRQAGDQHIHRHQFVTVTKEDASFGYGRHACPGRFFAATEIKLLIANLLMNFDIKMKDEDAKHGRFKNWEGLNSNTPDVTKEILLKRRK